MNPTDETETPQQEQPRNSVTGRFVRRRHGGAPHDRDSDAVAEAAPEDPVEPGPDAAPNGAHETRDGSGAVDELAGAAQAADGALRHAQADGIIRNHVIAGMSLGLLPLPLLDAVALSNVQYNLVTRLAEHYGVDPGPFSRALVASLVTGCAPVLAVAGAGSALKLIPGFGTLAGGSTVTLLAGAITFAAGRVMQRHFEAGGDFQDLDRKGLGKRLAEELEEGKRMVRELRATLPAFHDEEQTTEDGGQAA